jgi:hypothetical protein
VNSSGEPLDTTGAVSGIVLGADTPANDPLYDATDPTTGGGDTGSVLVSPYIRPGTVSTVYYNHYSWLRTMEDLFNVGRVSPAWTVRVTSVTPPSRVSRRSDRMCSAIRRARTLRKNPTTNTKVPSTTREVTPTDREAVDPCLPQLTRRVAGSARWWQRHPPSHLRLSQRFVAGAGPLGSAPACPFASPPPGPWWCS